MRKLFLTGLSVLTLSTVLAACQPTQSQTSETVSDTAVATKAVATNDNEMDTNAKLCLLYTSPSPRDKRQSRMPSSA